MPATAAGLIPSLLRLCFGLAMLLLAGCATTRVPTPITRPSLEPFLSINREPADSTGPVVVRFLGTTSLLLEDGETALLSDPFLSRPGAVRILSFRTRSDSGLVHRLLRDSLGLDSVGGVDAVFTTHSDFDHVLDAPRVAISTRARLLGSRSTHRYASEMRLDPRQILAGDTVHHGSTYQIGRFDLTFLRSKHSPGEFCPGGELRRDVNPPAGICAWRSDTVYSVLIRHGGGTALLHASAGFESRMYATLPKPVDVVYLAIGKLGMRDAAYAEEYWREVVCTTGARRVILTHWDDFSRGLDKPLVAAPYAADRTRRAVDRIMALALRDGVESILPSAVPEDQPVPPATGSGRGSEAVHAGVRPHTCTPPRHEAARPVGGWIIEARVAPTFGGTAIHSCSSSSSGRAPRCRSAAGARPGARTAVRMSHARGAQGMGAKRV